MKFKFNEQVEVVTRGSFYQGAKGAVVHYSDVDKTYVVALPLNRVESFYETELRRTDETEKRTTSKTDQKS